MNAKFILLLLAMLPSLSLAASVQDEAQFFSPTELAAVKQATIDAEIATGFHILVKTVAGTDGLTMDAFVAKLATEWPEGGDGRGVVLLISKKVRSLMVMTGDNIETEFLPDDLAKLTANDFASDRTAAGFIRALVAIAERGKTSQNLTARSKNIVYVARVIVASALAIGLIAYGIAKFYLRFKQKREEKLAYVNQLAWSVSYLLNKLRQVAKVEKPRIADLASDMGGVLVSIFKANRWHAIVTNRRRDVLELSTDLAVFSARKEIGKAEHPTDVLDETNKAFAAIAARNEPEILYPVDEQTRIWLVEGQEHGFWLRGVNEKDVTAAREKAKAPTTPHKQNMIVREPTRAEEELVTEHD